jgi:hypothetical protein
MNLSASRKQDGGMESLKALQMYWLDPLTDSPNGRPVKYNLPISLTLFVNFNQVKYPTTSGPGLFWSKPPSSESARFYTPKGVLRV